LPPLKFWSGYATDHTVPAAVQPLAFLHLARFVISCLGFGLSWQERTTSTTSYDLFTSTLLAATSR